MPSGVNLDVWDRAIQNCPQAVVFKQHLLGALLGLQSIEVYRMHIEQTPTPPDVLRRVKVLGGPYGEVLIKAGLLTAGWYIGDDGRWTNDEFAAEPVEYFTGTKRSEEKL